MQRLDGPWTRPDSLAGPGSHRRVVPVRGPGDFDPYLPIAHDWVKALDAKVVVELGVRAGVSTRALFAGVHETGGDLTVDQEPTPAPATVARQRFILMTR